MLDSDIAVRVNRSTTTLMQIGELSTRTGVSIRMLRYYEQQGLLQPRRRTSGYRDYDATDEQVAQRVRLLQASGLKLAAIKRVMPCLRDDQLRFRPCERAIDVLRREVADLDQCIETLAASRALLNTMLNATEQPDTAP